LPDLFGEVTMDEEVSVFFNSFFAKGTPSKSLNASFSHVVPSGGFIIEYIPHEFFSFWGYFIFQSPLHHQVVSPCCRSKFKVIYPSFGV